MAIGAREDNRHRKCRKVSPHVEGLTLRSRVLKGKGIRLRKHPVVANQEDTPTGERSGIEAVILSSNYQQERKWADQKVSEDRTEKEKAEEKAADLQKAEKKLMEFRLRIHKEFRPGV